jgi:uncharacterized protein YkwD
MRDERKQFFFHPSSLIPHPFLYNSCRHSFSALEEGIMKRAVLLLALVILGVEASTQGPEKAKFKPSEDEQRVIDLTNAERKKKDLPPVKFNEVLCEVARAHSANMAKQTKMEHNLDGKTPYERIKGAGYRYVVAAENLARADVTIEEVMEAWMASKTHRENILDPEFVEIGIGLARDEQNTYYTQVFAKPRKK